MNTTAIFVHLHEPENSESQVEFGGRGRARLPPDWLILSQIWLVDSSLPTSHHLNPLHERSQHVAADSSLSLSVWSLFLIICIYMKINRFFPNTSQPTGDASASYWLPCDSLHTSDWVTGFCAVSPFLENPERSEHEDRSVLLLILCTYLNHLWVFEFVTKQKVVLLLFPFFSGTKPGERWLCVHVPNTLTARPPHTEHSGSCFSS